MNLAAGDALSVTIGSAAGKARRIVEWVMPDDRSQRGRYVEEYQRRQNRIYTVVMHGMPWRW